jgi:VanZ family protein
MPSFFEGSDKVVHAGLYGVLGMSLGWGQVRSPAPPPHFVLILVGALYGATDEWHQVFVRGRTPDWSDWVADVVGVVCGYLLITASMKRRDASPPSDHAVDAEK